PVPLPHEVEGGGNYAVLVALPTAQAYASFYWIQTKTWMILGACLLITAGLGYALGNRFVKPLLEIMEITKQLREGHLYNKINLKRHDELGQLAEQVDAVVEKLADVV